MVEKIRFSGIARKFLFWFVIVSVTPFLIGLTVITMQMMSSTRQTISTELSVVRDMKVDQIRMWLNEKKTDVASLAADTQLRAMCEAMHKGNIEQRKALKGEVRDVMRNEMDLKLDFLQFLLIDAKTGLVAVSTDPGFEGNNRSSDPYYTEVIKNKRLFVKDIYRSEFLNNEPSMTVSVPIFCLEHKGEHLIAVLVGRLDLEHSLFPLLQERAGMGETGETLIVNNNVIALNSLLHDADAPLKRKITAEPAVLAAAGGTGIVEARDYRGEEVLAAYTYMPETGWGFVAKRDTSEIYAPVWSLLVRVALIGFAFLAGTVVLSFLVSGSLAKPVVEMSETAEKIAQGDLDARSPDTGESDEIGILGRSFNEMASKLKARMDLLEKISRVMTVSVKRHTRGDYGEDIINTLVNLTDAHMGVLYVAEDGGRFLSPVFALGMDPKVWEPIDSRSFEGMLGLSRYSGGVVRIANRAVDTPFVFRGPGGVTEAREIMFAMLGGSSGEEGLVCLGSLTGFEDAAEELLDNTISTLSTGLGRVVSSERIARMTRDLREKNEELQSQTEELKRQAGELQEQNVEIEQQRKQVEESSRLKSEFLSNMSHELRTPLNSILALSGVLLRKGRSLPEEQESEYLDIIERNGRQLLDLINDILDLSKIESGGADVAASFFTLSDTVQSLAETLAPLAGEKGIALKLDIPDDLPPLKSDESRIRQIIRNLMGNAIKFTSEGEVRISARVRDREAFIEVSDTGIGIAENDLPNIFDEFRQADGSASRQFGGTGLGLAIAQKTALLLGGTISAESSLGNGSTFTLRLPLRYPGPLAGEELLTPLAAGAESVPEAPSAASDIQNEAAGMPRILLVEDNDIAADQVKGLIEEEEMARVDIATDGKQALDYMAANTPPDAIILDLMMPEIDGFEVLDKLRGTEQTASIPVLILTAKDLSKADLSRLRNNNVQQLVQKGGVDRNDLVSRVRSLLGQGAHKGVNSGTDILVIEDNPDNLTTLKAMLQNGHVIDWAPSGKEGIHKAAGLKPGLILLDLSLPDMDGFEVLRRLREDEATRSIPVAAVTARAMKGDREKALEAGCEEYVTKPVDRDELHRVVDKLLK